MRSEDRLLRALFGEPRFWASYEEMAEAAEKLCTENTLNKERLAMQMGVMDDQTSRIIELEKTIDIEYQKGYEEGLKAGYENGVGSCQG
jgi:flagellar biosynthesis/type III secretory pathway protein FliH